MQQHQSASVTGVLLSATFEAVQAAASEVSPTHLAAALLRIHDPVISSALATLGVSKARLVEAVDALTHRNALNAAEMFDDSPELSAETRQIVSVAEACAASSDRDATIADLLVALLGEARGPLQDLFGHHGLSIDRVSPLLVPPK
jgi:ATP-dependent Clp protease ATP-binding subunit ClpA